MILICLAALLPHGVFGQFGGAGGGYNPPAPVCPMFKCASGEKAVGKDDHKIWSYGCKDSGMNILNTASFDPNNPYAGATNQKSVDKCCVERDICKQTCGMTSKACHDSFQTCSGKVCKGDQNCNLQAMLSEMMSDPYDADEAKDEKYDPDKSKCKSYNKGQSASCKCVPKDEFKSATEKTLKSFYGKYNKEKLNSDGEIKDVDEVWKKWKGKEAEMFVALGTKYKAKAVEIKEKPKPPPYKPPPKDDSFSDTANSDDYASDYNAEAEATPEPPPAAARAADPEDEVFVTTLKELKQQKQKAAQDEDYDAADEAKEKSVALKQAEAKRLNAKKKTAIADEDFVEAKRIKALIAKHEL